LFVVRCALASGRAIAEAGSTMKRRFSLLALLACALGLAPAWASDWEKIVGDSGRTVEIDASGIFDSDSGAKVSWGRVVLNDPEAQRAGYRTIKAMNRYDCLNRSFMTIKRAYLDDDDNLIREETLPAQTPTAVQRNSVDERIWSKVCKLPPEPLAVDKRKKRANPPAESLDQIAAAAHRAATLALQPVSDSVKAEVAPTPPRATPLPTANATVNTVTPVAPPPLLKPIPMPRHADADIAPAISIAPKRVQLSASARREPAPLILPAPTPTRRSAIPGPASSRAAAATPAATAVKWAYIGAEGPEFWAKLHPEWKLCGEGERQSPIDLSLSQPVPVDLDPVNFDYRPARFVITRTERLLQVKTGEGMGMEVRGQRYALEGFTLHYPAETRIDGRAADMEAHFFHSGGKGRTAILAVQFRRGEQASAPLQTLLNNLPLEKNDSYMPQTMIDLSAFLPKNPAHYLYMGSLSTPPCTEGVLWVLMKEPLTLTPEQYEIISRLHASNARPAQPANARLVLESR
jgi:carbonic anhydrase